MAELLLQGKIKDGDTVEVSAGKEGLVINGLTYAPGDEVFIPEAPVSHALH
jgi:hypothetical protein